MVVESAIRTTLVWGIGGKGRTTNRNRPKVIEKLPWRTANLLKNKDLTRQSATSPAKGISP